MIYHILRDMMITPDDFFAALANPIRLRSFSLLLQEKELCVCELMYALDISQPMISRHLAQLRKAGLLMDRREGQWVYYRLGDNIPAWINKVLHDTIEGVSQQQPYITDHSRLREMPDRPGASCCA